MNMGKSNLRSLESAALDHSAKLPIGHLWKVW